MFFASVQYCVAPRLTLPRLSQPCHTRPDRIPPHNLSCSLSSAVGVVRVLVLLSDGERETDIP